MFPRLTAAATLLTLATLALPARAEQTFQRTLTLTAAPDLAVSTGAGEIRIHPGAPGKLLVVGHVHAGWNAFGDVQKRIQQILDHPPIEQSGNNVRILEAQPNHTLYNNISIDYDITAPAATALTLHTGSGSVITDHVGRSLTAETGSGDLTIRGLAGPADLQCGSGSIHLEELAAADVSARSGSGDIELNGVRGAVHARTGSGSIQLHGSITAESQLGSGSGDLSLHLPSDARFNLEASTGSGGIHLRLPNAPQQEEHSHHHLTAAVHGGGPALELHTGSGSISIE